MRKSIFSEYFYLCAALISAAVICISVVLILISAEIYKNEKMNGLIRTAAGAAAPIRADINQNQGARSSSIQGIFDKTGVEIEIQFTLIDSDGGALIISEAAPYSRPDKKPDGALLRKITPEGVHELGSFENYYSESGFNFAYSIDTDYGKYFIFSRISSQSLFEYVTKMTLALCAASAAILAIVFIVVYMAANRLLKPIREMTIAARRFGEGDFSGKLYIHDQNELGFLANSLNEMASSLEKTEESRKSFISNVSHELRTPMTTIGGFVDGILDGTIPNEKRDHYLKIVSTEVDRLSRLVRSMLSASRYESGEQRLDTERFDIVPLLIQTVSMFEKRIEEKNIAVTGLDRPPFFVSADLDMALQVIFNLIENAVKFVNAEGYISFEFLESGSVPVMRIRNSGSGLNENEISKVFDRFYKADESRGIDKTGVGLGLSIVRSVIKLHGGVILVRSDPSEFVEFEFSFEPRESEVQ